MDMTFFNKYLFVLENGPAITYCRMVSYKQPTDELTKQRINFAVNSVISKIQTLSDIESFDIETITASVKNTLYTNDIQSDTIEVDGSRVFDIKLWFEMLQLLIRFIECRQQIPNKDNKLSKWLSYQNTYFKRKTKIMANRYVYNAWSLFLSKYKKYIDIGPGDLYQIVVDHFQKKQKCGRQLKQRILRNINAQHETPFFTARRHKLF